MGGSKSGGLGHKYGGCRAVQEIDTREARKSGISCNEAVKNKAYAPYKGRSFSFEACRAKRQATERRSIV